MKKLFYSSILFALVVVMAVSCSKDSTKTITETPAKSTIAGGYVVDASIALAYDSYEFGNKFYVSRNGNITNLGCKMAETGSFRVSLWDFATQNLIAATTITITDTSQFVYNIVSPIAVTANTRYVISLNNTSAGAFKKYFSYYKKPASGPSIYPFTTGSVTYENYREKLSATSAFPDSFFPNWALIGVSDFQFEYTE